MRKTIRLRMLVDVPMRFCPGGCVEEVAGLTAGAEAQWALTGDVPFDAVAASIRASGTAEVIADDVPDDHI